MADYKTSIKTSKYSSESKFIFKLLIWIRAVRAPFFTASIIPLSLGMAIAWYEGQVFNPILGIMTLISGVAIHAGTNLANDYFDEEADNINEFYSQFNGGSRIIQDQVLPSSHIIKASIASYFIGILLAILLIFLTNGYLLILFLIIAIGLGFFYTAIPVQFSYHGMGEIAVFVGFGPLGVLSAYYIQLGHINSVIPFFASIPIAILIAMVLFLNEFQDFEADLKANKRTLVVILGKKKSAIIYQIGLILTYSSLLLLLLILKLPLLVLLPVISFPLALKIIKIVRTNYLNINELLPANGQTIALHFIFGLLLIVGFILA